ncbi:protein-L-isoaspartate O-methyltransferase [Phytophthora cinnamomi]|uniref:protein-L-isoaspartate O-methyltransferase n=1 Tax=Phytophthora cinnamomi TaxID=4785 RepID=UPI00355AC2C9|nr:protein-L-isoaspartate O-methyltransferase [Phytophthora cinnamomi]
MAWRCSALSNDGLVDNLARAGIVQSQRVARAMKATDRAKYVAPVTESDADAPRPVSPAQAYQDAPQRLGYEQTISAPHMHAYALELADVAIHNIEHPRVLDVGAGSGYLTACLGHLVDQDGGRVFGIERIPQLAQLALKNIERADGDLVRRGIVSVERADGWAGLPNQAPFHFIHVGAAAVEPPRALMEQLAEGGRLVVPVGEQGASQVLLEIQRTDKETFTKRELMGVSYVPLVRQRTEL